MWDFIKYLLTVVGAGIVVVFVLVILITLLVKVYLFFKFGPRDENCDNCRYAKLNFIDEPCIYCEDHDHYQCSNLDGQDELK